MKTSRILVVDDEETIRYVLRRVLNKQYEVDLAETAEAALRLISNHPPDVALVDIVLPGMSGLQLLAEIKIVCPSTEVVMMTSHASAETTIQALRKGAYDYVHKPFEDVSHISMTVERALDKKRLSDRYRELLSEQRRKTEELSAAVTRLSSLIEAGRAMAETRSLGELSDFFIGLVAEELRVERASLMLIDDDARVLRLAACRGLDGLREEEICVSLGTGIAGSVAESGEPFLLREGDPEARLERSARAPHHEIGEPIALSVPIQSGDKILGVINVTDRNHGPPFSDADVAYLSSLAGQLGVATESARRFDELREAYVALKETQQQLVVSERIRAIGQMAAGIAHDLNNALSVILGRAEFGLKRIDDSEPDLSAVRRDLLTIRQVSLEGADTIKRIQEYARARGELHDQAVDMHAVVLEAVEAQRSNWEAAAEVGGPQIDVQFEFGDVPPVAGDAHELTQVVDNLILNSLEAMPRGGQLTFRTSRQGADVLLDVSDTGIGMSAETQQHLFEPFFTTKPTGRGLGTSVVYGIIARHRGEITVQSQEGHGTTFRVRLPGIDSESSVSVADSNQRPVQAQGQPMPTDASVLLVEDDPAVRSTYAELLASQGFQVFEFSNGAEALDGLPSCGLDLVVTDLSMPGMSGVELTRAIKRRHPAVPVILLSGWAVQQDEQRIRDAGIDFIASKPCPAKQLLELVRQALETRERPAASTQPAS
ncbi:MAG: response regulator [Acidobacteriota bacterium]|nr:MAG: response regulator [Acidobacteriota bacterium]